MVTIGSLEIVLAANSDSLNTQMERARKSALATAESFKLLTDPLNSDFALVAGMTTARTVSVQLIKDLDKLNSGLALSQSLSKGLGKSFNELQDTFLLQLAQNAQFLSEDLFEGFLAPLRSASLEEVGLGGLENAYRLVTAGQNAVRLLLPLVKAGQDALAGIADAIDTFQSKVDRITQFFTSIASNAKLAGNVIKIAIDLIDGTIEGLLNTLALLSPEFGQLLNLAKALGVEFKVGESYLGKYVEDLAAIQSAAEGSAKATTALSMGLGQVKNGFTNAGKGARDFENYLKGNARSAASAQKAMKYLAQAGNLFDSWKKINDVLDPVLGSLQDTFMQAKNAENFRTQLMQVSTSAGGAGEDLQYLTKLSKDLGIQFDSTSQGFLKFASSVRGTALESKTQDTYAGIAQAISVMRLSADQAQGVLLAFSQIASKGVLSMEEIQQIAERVPGTFQIAARAMGTTTAELRKLIETGQVDSISFLDKFAQQLKAETQGGVVASTQSAEAALNRASNAAQQFQIAAGEMWKNLGTPAINAYAQSLEFAAKNEMFVSTIIDTVLIASLGKAALSAISMAKATLVAYKTNEQLRLSIQSSVQATARYAAQFAVLYTAIIVFYALMERVKNSASSTTTAIASLDQSLTELAESGKDTKKELAALLPKEPPPIDWLDTAVKGLKDFEEQFGLVGKAAATLVAPLIKIGLEVNKLINFFKTGNYEIVTGAEKALNDQLVAIEEFAAKSQDILSKSLDLRQATQNGTGPLKELEDVEAALKRIQQQRLQADPKDQQSLNAIAEEEAKLLERQAAARKEVLANQGALNNALTQAKQQLQELNPSQQGTEGYEKAKQQLETQVRLLEKEKNSLDELVDQSKVTAESITKDFEKSSKALDKSFSETQADIEESLAAGSINQEQARQEQLDAEQAYLEQRLKLNRETAEKLRTELENNAKLKAIDPTKATLSAEKEKEYQKQLEQIDLDIAKNRIDLAKNVQANKEQLNEQELEDIRAAQAEAESLTKRTENSRIAEIKQRQVEGKLSEEAAAKEIEEVQKQGIQEQIAAEKAKLDQIDDLKARGVLTAEKAAEQEREVLDKLSDLNLQCIDAELQARKAANDKAVQDLEDGIKQAEAAIGQSKNNREQAVANKRLGGSSEQEAARETLQIQQQTTAQTIALKRQEIENEEALGRRGAKSAKDVAESKRQLTAEIGELSLQQINDEIKGQQDLINAVGEGAKEQLDAVSTAEAQKIAKVKQTQAQRGITEQQAAEQIAQINLGSAQENLKIKEQELAELQALRNSGQATIKEGADKEKQLVAEVAQARQQVSDAEIANRQREINALDQKLASEQTAAEIAQANDELRKQSLTDQSNLLSAQADLMSAQNSLAEQRLQYQIDEAEKQGETAKAEQLKKQLLDQQIRAQEQQARIALEQLRLKQEQNKLEMDGQRIQAEVAVSEAQNAILKAKINGASAEELGNLEKMLGLRNQQLDALNQQAAGQARLNQLEEQTLRTQQQQTREALKQQQIQAAAVTTDNGLSNDSGDSPAHLDPAGGSGGRGGSSLGAAAGAGGSQKPLSIMQITDKLTDLGRNGNLATAFSAANLNLGLKLGRTDIGKLGMGNGADLGGKLDQLIELGKKDNRPNLSISNINDLGMAGQIYGDISRDSFRSAGL